MHAVRSAALAALLCGTAFAAQAQWQWLDKDGRKVFSDRPPPPEVPENRILKQPGVRSSAPVPAPTAAPAPAAGKPAAPQLPGKDAALDARKKAEQDAEAQKKKAEEDKVAAARAESCQRARQNLATLDSGMRLAQVNQQGERIILDDDARAAETQRIQGVIASDCGPARQP